MSDPAEHAPLLHNMSAPPKTVVTYTGLSGLATSSRSGGAGAHPEGVGGAGVFGLPLRFALPEDFAAGTPAAVLAALGAGGHLGAGGGEGTAPAQQAIVAEGASPGDPALAVLERLIDARAAELPLPDGCLVVPAIDAHAAPWPDPLSALAVLAKCSDTVWLRAKTPSLPAALARRRASLLVPPSLVPALGLPQPSKARRWWR